jgi:putative ABC transport system ATP-binding protein
MNKINSKFITVKNLIKEFDEGMIKALRGVDLEIEKGEFVAIMGPSGCGKSTLLNMIGALDQPDSGEVIVDGKNLVEYKDLSLYRSQKVGFIFQLHNLIPTLTALENVQIPMFNTKIKRKERRIKAQKLLEMVGLKGRDDNLSTKLSGGERQKIAVARALANDPEIIIADEPTGNLDFESSQVILDLLKKIHQETGTTIILVTHDRGVASFAERIIQMRDGRIEKK